MVPSGVAKPIKASKLQKGIKEAQKAIRTLLDGMAGTLGDGFVVKEIELTASFNAEGKSFGISLVVMFIRLSRRKGSLTQNSAGGNADE